MNKITVTVLFLLTFLTSSCGGVLLDGDERFKGIQLTLENAGKSDEDFKHPSKLDLTYVENVVDSLYYKIITTGDVIRIFDKEDVQSITNEIIAKFQQADESEKIRFSYYGNSDRETKGFTYIDAHGKWNWVFQKINASTVEDSWAVYTGKYFHYKTVSTLLQGDITKKNWVLTTKANVPETITGIAGVTHKKAKSESLENQNNYNSKKELKRIDDANERLRFLKKLFEGGYITEDDYLDQKRRVINQM